MKSSKLGKKNVSSFKFRGKKGWRVVSWVPGLCHLSPFRKVTMTLESTYDYSGTGSNTKILTLQHHANLFGADETAQFFRDFFTQFDFFLSECLIEGDVGFVPMRDVRNFGKRQKF